MITEKLTWDSDFFGLPIYKISGETQIEELKVSVSDLPSPSLTYLYTDPGADQIHQYCKPRFSLLDKKVLFHKKLTHHHAISDKSICAYNPDQHGELISKIYQLAFLSGHSSRFKLDPRIHRKKFEDLYTLWIDHTIDKSFGLELLICLENQNLKGICTINEKNSKAIIGLIAVNKDHQGQLVGSRLLNAAEFYVLENNLKEMIIPTQRQNTQACNFYKKNGYELVHEEWIYHIWK